MNVMYVDEAGTNRTPQTTDGQGVARDNSENWGHGTDGTLLRTDSFLREPTTEALTDYGIGGALDDPSLDGSISMEKDPTSSIVPSAPGPATGYRSNLGGDGPAFLSAYTIGQHQINAASQKRRNHR